MDKNDKDIRKEIEELEKLIDKVKKQNEETKKEQKKSNKPKVIRINIASSYSVNFWINLALSFLINFIVIFAMLKLFDFASITNDLYIIYFVLIFTVLEESVKKYLLTKHIKIVLFTSGMILTLLNIIWVYMIDLFVFTREFSFLNYMYPAAFIVFFQLVRTLIKNIYFRLNNHLALKKMKRR